MFHVHGYEQTFWGVDTVADPQRFEEVQSDRFMPGTRGLEADRPLPPTTAILPSDNIKTWKAG